MYVHVYVCVSIQSASTGHCSEGDTGECPKSTRGWMSREQNTTKLAALHVDVY